MGECGCVQIQYQARVMEKSGEALLIGIYPGCQNCSAPAGVDFFRVPKEDWEMWDVMQVPELQTWEGGMWCIPVVHYKHLRKAMEEMITGIKSSDLEDGVLDEVYAEIVAEETFPDTRDVVHKTLDEWKKMNSTKDNTAPPEGA